MNQEEQLQQFDVSTDQANAAIELGQSLEYLYGNPHFQRVILDGYFDSYSSELVMLKADPAYAAEAPQKGLDKSISGIGELYQHFRAIRSQAEQMKQTVADNQEARNAIMEEG